MKTKIMISLMFVAILTFNTTAYAETNANQSSNDYYTEKLDAAFQDMKETLKSGGEVSIGTSLEKVDGLSISTEPIFNLDNTSIDWDNLDSSLTNLGFGAVSVSLAGAYGNVDLSGQANGCTELFEASFGNLINNIELKEPELPKDFNADTMLKNSQKNINTTYKNALNDSSINTVKNTINVNNIFSQAAKGPSSQEVKSIKTLCTELGIPEGQDREKMFKEDESWVSGKKESTSSKEADLLAYISDNVSAESMINDAKNIAENQGLTSSAFAANSGSIFYDNITAGPAAINDMLNNLNYDENGLYYDSVRGLKAYKCPKCGTKRILDLKEDLKCKNCNHVTQ